MNQPKPLIPDLHQNGTLVISDDNTFCLEQNHKYTDADGIHDVPESLQLERAAFIVKAVNCHQELVDALQRCYEVFKMDEVDTAISLQVGMALAKVKADA